MAREQPVRLRRGNMKKGSRTMFYISAAMAVVGAISYQYFVKRVPVDLNPVVSVIGVYLSVLVLSTVLLLLVPSAGGLASQFRHLGWIQLAIAVSVIFIEIGYLLMYRYGWNLSTGNLVTGVVINVVLVGLGIVLLREKANAVNILGIALSILGVALISYRP